jgi:NAD(P)-dependent dehydrogenase (short-subunit alcohol dehydrogenase family)
MPSVLITGGNRGLGAALVTTFARNGWAVAATARDIGAIVPKEGVRPYALDLSLGASVDACATTLGNDGWVFDLVIHNAGFNPKDRKSPADYFTSTFAIAGFSGANVADALWVNALMPMQLTSRLLPHMAGNGTVLAISSWLGSIGGKTSPGHYGYAGSKALLNMFMRGLSLEFGANGRSAVALNPGWMKTEMGGANAKETPDDIAGQIFALAMDGVLSRSNGMFINADGSPHPW